MRPSEQNLTTDILVVGAGIAGLTTSYLLLKAGKQVTVVEDGFIGSGESGRTTAHLTCALDDRYYEIEKTLEKNIHGWLLKVMRQPLTGLRK